MPDDTVELVIDRLGARGDGIASVGGGTVYVAFALPGERVRVGPRAEGRAPLVEVRHPSASRVAPVCRHFGDCGGCQLQHLAFATYLDWKREQVRKGLAARGLDVPVAPVMTFPHGRRRRVVLSARRDMKNTVLGFRAFRGHRVIDLAECPVVVPEIERALPALASLAAPVLARQSHVDLGVLCAENGLDVQMTGADGALDPVTRESLATLASAAKLIRLTVARDTIFSTAAPIVRFGRACVIPPPGGFLQPMAEAEAAMAQLIRAALVEAKHVADLFCGLGAFTFPLAERSRVMAVDSDASAIQALDFAARRTSGVKPVTVKTRDLFRVPLSPRELADFDAVVFDPPRAGARAQADAIACSKVPVAVAVSCNMATLARDARALVDGGYRIETVTPIDQFRYSSHIEAVAVFRR